jgi:hypothetical protein
LVLIPPSFGGCNLYSTIAIPARTTLTGAGITASHLLAAVRNLSPALQFTGDGAAIRDIEIDSSSAGPNVRGTVVETGNHSSQRIENVQIDGPCIGVDINGNTTWVDRLVVNNIQGSGCGGWRVGTQTTFAGTVGARVTNSVVGGDSGSASFDQEILDSGGLYEANDDLLLAGVGTEVNPGANQEVDWAFFSNTVLGDSNTTAALVLDTRDPSGVIKGLECVGCWAASQSSTSGSNIFINNNGRGTVVGIHFVGLRDYNSAGNGAVVNDGSNIYFESSRFCGIAGTSDILVANGVNGFKVSGGVVGGQCDSFKSVGAVHGIVLAGSNNDVQIVGVDFSGVEIPVSGTPVGNSVVSSNIGLDSAPQTLASASSISLNPPYPVWRITGTSTIKMITGGWSGRAVTIIPTGGPIHFATGGNICTRLTSANNTPVLAIYADACWYLK